MFSTSARQGDTDTTAKLFGAGAKWLVPGLGILLMKASQVRLRLVVWRAWFGRCRTSSPVLADAVRVARKSGSGGRGDQVVFTRPASPGERAGNGGLTQGSESGKFERLPHARRSVMSERVMRVRSLRTQQCA